MPTLYVFNISHYCEKARWALDYLKIEHQIQVIAPGTHRKIAQKAGLKRGSVPFLMTQSGVVQGSDAILDWAEGITATERSLSGNSPDVRRIEQRLDSILGIHVRRWYYSEAIIEQPAKVKPIFMQDLPVWERAKLSLSWPLIRKLMVQGMDLGPQQGLESLQIVLTQLDWLEPLLAKQQTYLAENRFTRADMTAASLLSPLVKPSEHPCADAIHLPPRLAQQYADIADRPIWHWVRRVYQRHRHLT